MELQFKITNDHICEVGLKIAPVADSVNHLYAAFEFDDAWDGAVKTAIFGGGGKTYHVILKSDNKCVIPWEVLTGPCFTVSAFGITGTERITATELKIPLAPSGYKNGQSPSEPSDSAYTQLLQMLSWVITNKAALTKFAEGSTDVPDMINIPTEDGSITLTQALDGKADTSALGSYYTKTEMDTKLTQTAKLYQVEVLPTENIDENGIYLMGNLPHMLDEANYDIRAYVYDGTWRTVGVTAESVNDAIAAQISESTQGISETLGAQVLNLSQWKADKPTITTPTGTSAELTKNTEARFGEVASLTGLYLSI